MAGIAVAGRHKTNILKENIMVLFTLLLMLWFYMDATRAHSLRPRQAYLKDRYDSDIAVNYSDSKLNPLEYV